jgi:hypothetical protein
VTPALALENIRGTALSHGVATAEEIDWLVDELYALARDERIFVANPCMVQVIGVKPA